MPHFLEIKNLHKSYYYKNRLVKEALIDVTLKLMRGEILGLLGVNGAGKTTLSSLIATLHPPTSGTLLWQEESIFNNLSSYRKKIGLCPQQQNLDSNLSLDQNLHFQGSYYGLSSREIVRKKEELFEQFELKEYADSQVAFLSGGYKQRFLFARALIHNPELVILDEPTVGLDPQVRHKLWEAIAQLKKEGKSVLLTTHYLDEAERLCDRVAVMDQGRIKITDTPDRLKERCHKGNLEDVFLHLLKEEKSYEL